LERLQNSGQGIVELSHIDGVDGAEGRGQLGVVEHARQDGFSQGNGAVPFEFYNVQLDRALGPYQQDVVVGCYRFPDGFRPLLPAVNALLITPHGDVVSLESALKRLYGAQVMTRIADEHPWHLDSSTPPVLMSEIVPSSNPRHLESIPLEAWRPLATVELHRSRAVRRETGAMGNVIPQHL
jgi:hypothetical protein